MKLVPKPEGFELRDRRSEKVNDATKWLPRDALYAASEAMTDKADAVVITWREVQEDGTHSIHRRNAGPRGSAVNLNVSALGAEMGWTK